MISSRDACILCYCMPSCYLVMSCLFCVGGVCDVMWCRALKYRDMKVEEVMTPAKSVFMLSVNERLNYHVSTAQHWSYVQRYVIVKYYTVQHYAVNVETEHSYMWD